MHGGMNGDRILDDLWAWDGTRWTEVPQGQSTPGRRRLHAIAFDEARNRTVLYGGVRPDTTGQTRGYDDTWEWDGREWMRIRWPVGSAGRAALDSDPSFNDGTHTTMRTRSDGFTLIELLIVVAIIGIIAAIAVPGLLRARMSGNEASAIGSLRAINSAEASYSTAAGSGGYATALAVLSAACPGSSQGFISPDLKSDPSVKSGYSIALLTAGAAAGPADCNAAGTQFNYYVTGAPVAVGTTGNRGFSTGAAGTIFYTPNGVPPTLAVTLASTGTPIQ